MNAEQTERMLELLERIADALEASSDLAMSSADVMEQTKPGILGKANIPVLVRLAATELNVIGR